MVKKADIPRHLAETAMSLAASALDRHLGVHSDANLLAGVGKAFARRDVPVREAFTEAGLIGSDREREAEETRMREALRRETIDEGEARWLSAKIGADGVLHEGERRLLRFIKQESPSIHPLLDDLFAKAGI